jgi:predicted ribonuclease YlaK
MAAKLTKRERRRLRKEGLLDMQYELDVISGQPKHGFSMKKVTPRTERQADIFEKFDDNHLMVHGYAGTGKTYVLMYLALQQIMDPSTPYEKLKIFRSAVATRNIGYLPGNVVSKMESFEGPYMDISGDLFDRGDAYAILKHKGLVEFHPTSFIRGSTYNNTIVLVDECQNLSWHEFSSLITRCGHNTKYLFSGDSAQSDLHPRSYEVMDIHRMITICEAMPSFDLVEMEIDDIVRSGLVKEFLIHAQTLEYGT